jgi:hypothetical protein
VKPFDEQLFQLKMKPINQRMHSDAGKCWGRARAEVQRLGNHAALLPTYVECQLEVLRKYLEELYELRREVWLLDGNTVTPEFIRKVVVPHAFTVIGARKGAIEHELDLLAKRTGEHQRGGHILVHQMNRLRDELATRYEIAALELLKKESRDRKVTQAPPPPREVGGLGATYSRSKPTQIPPDFPVYFPKELKARTALILAEAVRKFQYQTQTLELCKHVISEMTPHFCEAVANGTMKASMVLEEGLGGMGDLVRWLLVHNDDGPHSGWGLSNEAYRLQEEARKSDEWLRLARAIVEAEEQHRTLPTLDQNKIQTPETESTNAAAGNRREAFLKPILKEKGFSVHDWANEAKVDFHTANGYLKGKTKPYPTTLKKLADALGIEVAKLPE